MTAEAGNGPASAEDQLRDIRAITDAELSRLDADQLLKKLLERLKAIMDADTAAVLLLDVSGRYLAATAASGLEEEVYQGVRIPIGLGFAGLIAADRRPVVIDRVDDSTVVNPILIGRGIRRMMGAPLMTGGRMIGVIHVGTLGCREFTQDDAALLQLAAQRAADAVHVLQSRADRAAATTLARSLLPDPLPDVPELEMAARYVPGQGDVGGDWYDVFPLPSGEVGAVIGDVAGAGLAAAVTMGRMRSTLRAYALQSANPADVLASLDVSVQAFEPETVATVLYAVFDTGRNAVRVSSAGHLQPIAAVPGMPAELADVRSDLLIGVSADAPRHSTTLQLPPDGVLCLYTDGLVERRRRLLDDGVEALRRAVVARPAERVCADVMVSLVGTEAGEDDMTILVLRRVPPYASGCA